MFCGREIVSRESRGLEEFELRVNCRKVLLFVTGPYLVHAHHWARSTCPNNRCARTCRLVGPFTDTVGTGPCIFLTRSPPLVRTHTSNPAFPTGDSGLGGFVFSFAVVVLDVVAAPLEGGGPTVSSQSVVTQTCSNPIPHRTSAPAPAPGNNGTGRQKKRGLKD